MRFLDSHPLRGAFVVNTLERLASLIVEQGDVLLRDAELDFPSRAASTVLLLGERARISAADLAKALGDANLRETFTKGAVEPVGGSAAELAKLAQADSAKYARLVKELGIRTN